MGLCRFFLLTVIITSGCVAIESLQERGHEFAYQIEHHIGDPSVASHSSSHPSQQAASIGLTPDVSSPNKRAQCLSEVADHLQIQIEEPDLESGVVDEDGFSPGSASPDAVALMKTSSKVTPLELNKDLMDKCSQQTAVSPITDRPDRCPICLSAFRSSDLNFWWEACGHRFHKQCIQPWIDHHPTCPVCRRLIFPASQKCPSVRSISRATRHPSISLRPRARNQLSLWRERSTNLMLSFAALLVLLLLVKENWMR